jgi:hypothetical protein
MLENPTLTPALEEGQLLSSLSVKGKRPFKCFRLILSDEKGVEHSWVPNPPECELEDEVQSRWSWKGPLGPQLHATLRVVQARNLDQIDVSITIENPGRCPFSSPEGTVYFKAIRAEVLFTESMEAGFDGIAKTPLALPLDIQLGSELALRAEDWSRLLNYQVKDPGRGTRKQSGIHPGVVAGRWPNQTGLVLARRDAAYEHPTGFHLHAEKLVLDLLSQGGTGPHYAGIYGSPHNPADVPDPRSLVAYRFEGGRHKTFTHRILFTQIEPTADECQSLANSLATPPLIKAHPEYVCGPGSPGFLISPFRDDKNPNRMRWQQLLRILVDDDASDDVPNSGKKGMPKFLREGGNAHHVNPYGWHNFGDLPWADGYASLHYDHPRTHFSAFLASGDRRYFDSGLRMLLHQRDVDMVHTSPDDPYTGGQRYEKGWYHGNGMAPSQSHHWIGGLYLHYVMTGDPQTRATLVEAGRYLLSINSHQWHGLYSARLAGWPLDNLVTAWLLDGDPVFKERARATIDRFEVLEKTYGSKGYVLNPATRHDPSGTPACMQGWMHGIFLSAAARYVIETQDREPMPLLQRVAQHLATEITVRSSQVGNRFEPAKCHNLWAPGGYTKSTTTQYAWAPMAGMAQVAWLTGDEKLWEVADDLFTSCVRFFQGAPPRQVPVLNRSSTWSPISMRMSFSNTEEKILGQIGFFSMGYHWLQSQMKPETDRPVR